MTTDLGRPARAAGTRKVSPRSQPHHRDVILHSHPRFVDLMREFTDEFSSIPPDCIFSYDLNRLPAPSDGGRPSETEEIPVGDNEPLLSLQISRADRIYIGVEPGTRLPAMWKLVLLALLKSRPHAKGSLVLLEESHPDPELVEFLESLANDSDLDLVQWRKPLHPAACVTGDS